MSEASLLSTRSTLLLQHCRATPTPPTSRSSFDTIETHCDLRFRMLAVLRLRSAIRPCIVYATQRPSTNRHMATAESVRAVLRRLLPTLDLDATTERMVRELVSKQLSAPVDVHKKLIKASPCQPYAWQPLHVHSYSEGVSALHEHAFQGSATTCLVVEFAHISCNAVWAAAFQLCYCILPP